MPSNLLKLTSAKKLTEAEIKSITGQLGLKPGQVVIENEVDESIIGGLIIKYNGYYLDMSLKGKLDSIVNSIN